MRCAASYNHYRVFKVALWLYVRSLEDVLEGYVTDKARLYVLRVSVRFTVCELLSQDHKHNEEQEKMSKE